MSDIHEHKVERPELSAVIPVFNEQDNLEFLYERLSGVLSALAASYEIVLVDDGSADLSWEIIERICQRDAKVKGVKFARNFGQHVAITAGLDHCEGRAVILMDADMQDPPETLGELYRKFKEGYDIVCAVRENRADPIYRRALARAFYVVFKLVSRIDIPANSGVFRIISRRVVERLAQCPQRHKFITGWISALGFSQAVVKVRRDERQAGKTQYNFIRLMRLALGGLISCPSAVAGSKTAKEGLEGPVYCIEKTMNFRKQ